MNITKEKIIGFKNHLISEERSSATVEKYVRDVLAFSEWLCGREVDKNTVVEYKAHLAEKYQASSTNSMLSSLNSFFVFCERHELRVKFIKTQKQLFSRDDRELTKAEYLRLLDAAKRKSRRLYLLMQTVCATGIRVSELKFITVEAVSFERAEIDCKGKRRIVFIPKKLCKMLKDYAKSEKIKGGSIFVTKSGKPLDRSNIWSDMKKLCADAGVSASKVFPHNLRHLFARTFYTIQKDIVRLSSILGHSNINTTMIYTMESGRIHQKQIQQLGLLC